MERRRTTPFLRLEMLFGASFLFIAALFFKWEFFVDRYEDVAYATAPSAGRAFEYGERHFNAGDSGVYDIDRAEYFFLEAALQNPGLPYVYHELARVYFLKGDFPKALGFINAQVALHGDEFPNTYYVRALIEGYKGEYAAS